MELDSKRIIVTKLQQELVELRSIIAKSTSQNHKTQTNIVKVENIMLALYPTIKKYVDIFKNFETQPVSLKSILQLIEINEGKHEALKINLYIWQALNFLCVNNLQIRAEVESILPDLFEIDLKYEHISSPNSIKNAMIFIHNYLAKSLKKEILSGQLKEIICQLVVHNFQRDKQTKNTINQSHLKTKNEDHVVQEMEWLGYIFMKLFNWDQSKQRQTSMIKQLCQASKRPQITYYLLHSLNNYLQNMIDQRTTTQLVAGYESPLADVRQMYKCKQKAFVSLCLSEKDLRYAMEIYKLQIIQYRKIFKEYVIMKLDTKDRQNSQKELKAKWKHNADLLTQIGHLLNCLLFIGGYNNKLQDVVIQTMFEKDQLIFQHMELSYLLFRNIQSTLRQTKLEILVEVQKQAKKKLLEAAQISSKLQEVNIKDLELESILAPGQLVIILRLFNNLVHINRRAQIPFENDPKYLHMIMSLTHDSASQATMRQWSILFIKNVSESQKLREEIGKVQMELKVE